MFRSLCGIVTVIGFVPVLWSQDFRAKGRAIPDPNQHLAVAQFLANESVLSELKLAKEEKDAITALLQTNNGDLYNVTFEVGPNLPSYADLKARSAAIRHENESKLNEIIDPVQRNRLREIAFQIELARVGPGEALCSGFLGREVGIEEYQKASLTIAGEHAGDKARLLMKEIIRMAREEVFAELSEAQRSQLKRVLGKPFDFLDERKTIRYEYRNPGFCIPDPSALIAITGLAMKQSVATEIGLSSIGRKTLDNLHRDSRNPKEAIGSLVEIGLRSDPISEVAFGEIRSQVDQLFDTSQKTRLKELAYHIEIARIGAIAALLDGYLGQALEIDTIQKVSLKRKRDEVQKIADEKLHRVLIGWRAEVFSELTSTQRDHAEKLLGKEFYLREEPSGFSRQ